MGNTGVKKNASPGLKRGNPNWQKGVSGNPNGRPKGALDLSGILRRKLLEARKMPDGSNRTVAELVMERVIAEAEAGNPKFAAMLLDRAEGTVTQKVEHSVEEQTLKIVRGVDEEKL